MAKTYFMDWCPDLIVRTDIGHSSGDHKHIATASCKAESEAKDSVTGVRVTGNTFQ